MDLFSVSFKKRAVLFKITTINTELRMKAITLCLLLAFFNLSYAQSNDFPGRTVYPKINVYETSQLLSSFDDVIIIDARSQYEYNVLHINTAINIPLSSKRFARDLASLNNNGKPIVFYCNGHTCYKSYKAVLKAKQAGLSNVFSYDAGVFDWANAHPEKTTMLNVTPMDPANIIPKSDLKKHLLSPKEFQSKITENSIILDIRDTTQRGLLSLFPYRQKNISLEQREKLSQLFDKVLKKNLPLFIYDAAGKQVRWLQYYIEAKGIKNYYFMKGGFKKYFAKG